MEASPKKLNRYRVRVQYLGDTGEATQPPTAPGSGSGNGSGGLEDITPQQAVEEANALCCELRDIEAQRRRLISRIQGLQHSGDDSDAVPPPSTPPPTAPRTTTPLAPPSTPPPTTLPPTTPSRPPSTPAATSRHQSPRRDSDGRTAPLSSASTACACRAAEASASKALDRSGIELHVEGKDAAASLKALQRAMSVLLRRFPIPELPALARLLACISLITDAVAHRTGSHAGAASDAELSSRCATAEALCRVQQARLASLQREFNHQERLYQREIEDLRARLREAYRR